MNRKNVRHGLIMVLLIAGFVASSAHGSDLATHMAVARRTLDVWQSFDSSFYNVIAGTPTGNYGYWRQRITQCHNVWGHDTDS
jgi:hypothetical protein